jgi:hypothetical protein
VITQQATRFYNASSSHNTIARRFMQHAKEVMIAAESQIKAVQSKRT